MEVHSRVNNGFTIVKTVDLHYCGNITTSYKN